MSSENEARQVRGRYARRDAAHDAERYALTNPYALAAWQERQRSMLQLLGNAGLPDFARMQVLEIGCGAGGNLLDFLRLGVRPEHLQGLELLSERAVAARAVLPDAARVLHADALDPAVALPGQSQDLIVLFTVFSSILSSEVRQRLAQRAWGWLRPGGAVLWHDFVVNNPRNPDVRGVPLQELRALFPEARLSHRRVTLAPPLGRALCRISPALYPVFNVLAPLRTHALCMLRKSL